MRQKVFIGIVAHRFLNHTQLTLALAAGSARLARYPFDVVEYTAASKAIVDEARNELLEVAIGREVDWCVMLDDDVCFGPDTLGEVLSLAQAHDNCVVAGCPAPRSGTQESNVQPPTGTGFCEVERIGGALMVINVPRLLRCNFKRPWFVSIPQATGLPISEDYFFCDALRGAGGGVYCHFTHRLRNGSDTLLAP